jgi:hypothetical protein
MDTIQVNGTNMDVSEFEKMKEDISKDKSKKLKKINENEYKVLEKMNG